MNYFKKLIFNIWYFRSPPWDTNQTPPELMDFISACSPGKALDLGCGTGTNAIWLAQQGWQVTGVDFAARAINISKRKAAAAGVVVDFRQGDVTNLSNVFGPYNFILDIGCYHNLNNKGMMAYRQNINRLLNKGGFLMLYVFYRGEGSKPGRGVVDADLMAFSPKLTLISRTDGLERGSRPSTWLRFKKDIE